MDKLARRRYRLLMLLFTLLVFGTGAAWLGRETMLARQEQAAYQDLRALGASGDDWVGWREWLGSEYRPIVQISLPPTVTLKAAMPHLLRLDNLEFLDLSDNPIVDSDLSKLLQLDWIDSLSLSSTQINDASIPDLATMRNLRFLYLKKTRITDDGFRELQRALPHCRFDR